MKSTGMWDAIAIARQYGPKRLLNSAMTRVGLAKRTSIVYNIGVGG